VDHKKLQGKANKALKKDRLLVSLEAEKENRVTDGLSSGSMMLNMALSGNPLVGYAWGKLVEIYGTESSGKTTLALHAIFEAQRLERASKKAVPCVFIDAEHALDPTYAESIGIDLANLTLSQPDCGEDALDAVEECIAVGYKLIVIDSVAALTPRAEIEGEMGDSHMGLQARLMSQACRKLVSKCHKSDAIIIFINQIRLKIGIVFGNPETTPGGKALKFYCTYRVEVRAPRKGAKTGRQTLAGMGSEDNVEIGTTVNLKVVKNKMFPPHRKASFYIHYGEGIDRYKDAIDFLVYTGAFKERKDKKVLLIPSKKKYYTASRLLTLFRTDPEIQQDIIDIVRDYAGVEK